MYAKKCVMKKFALYFLFILLTVSSTYSAYATQPVADGEEIISNIYSKYANNWYKHITFKQNMFRYKNDSLVRNEVWLVAYSSPSMLHIRYKDFSTGRGWLVVNDTLYSFNHSKLIGTRPRLHELMVLSYDLYSVKPDFTIPKVLSMGFDLLQVAIVEKKGKEYYQIGNPDVKCFWVSKDDLLFHGVRKVDENGVNEIFYQKYEEFYGKLVATEVQYFDNGQMYLYEKYFDIRLPSCMPEDFFSPELFGETRW